MKMIKNVLVFMIAVSLLMNTTSFANLSTNEWQRKRLSSEKLKHASQDNAFSMPYRLFKPANYKANQIYPLVVYLHDENGKGIDNISQLTDDCIASILSTQANLSKHPCFILVPQCPNDQNWVNGIIDYSSYSQGLMPITDELNAVTEIIRSVQAQYSIDTRRTYVGGLGEGATATWDLCTRYPEMFAAAFPIAGRTDPSSAEKMVKIPTWAFHASMDPVISVTATINMMSEIEKKGGKTQFTEIYSDIHDITQDVYSDSQFLWWLFAQRKDVGDYRADIADVDIGDERYDSIRYVVNSDILSIDKNDCFHPDSPPNFDEIVVSLLKVAGFEYKTNVDYMNRAGQFGLGTYATSVTRELLAYMIEKVFLSNNSKESFIYEPIFKDNIEISGVYRQAIAMACSVGLFDSNVDGGFNPKVVVSRAELATVLHRLIEPQARVDVVGLKKVYDSKSSEVIANITEYDSRNDYYENPGFIIDMQVTGNLIADSMRNRTGADAAIVTKLDLKRELSMGELTINNVFEMIATNSDVVLIEIAGTELIRLLDNGTGEDVDTSILSVSGLKYTYDSSDSADEKILYPRIESIPLDINEMYKVVISYNTLAEYIEFAKFTVEHCNFDITQLVIEHIQQYGVTRTAIEDHRIRIK